MFRSKHSQFILAPLEFMLKSGVNACSGVLDGINTYPLCEYVMQSLFLKMTGAQEQKFKCICWDIATNDYEYRYDYLNGGNFEVSVYKTKVNIYQELCKKNGFVGKTQKGSSFKEISKISSKQLDNIKEKIKDIFENSFLRESFYQGFQFFLDEWTSLFDGLKFNNDTAKNTMNQKTSFSEHYKKIVYEHRNRCAHNTISYQQNLPDLNKLADREYKYENYFFRFGILLLIDELITEAYQTYCNKIFD